MADGCDRGKLFTSWWLGNRKREREKTRDNLFPQRHRSVTYFLKLGLAT
jgi:hypothetical protein